MLSTMKERKKLSKEEALKARMEPASYAVYKSETNRLGELFRASVESKDWEKISWESSLMFPTHLYCQKDYSNIIFDYRECRYLGSQEEKPEGYLTMADGGTIPCALLSILEHYNVETSLEELGKVLVENGYRTENKGVLWSAVDIVPEVKYGIKTKIVVNVKEIAEALKQGKPILALVPASYIQQKEGIPTNQAAIIWGTIGYSFSVTSTSRRNWMLFPRREEFLPQIKRAWIIG